jgi:hypothetical protein
MRKGLIKFRGKSETDGKWVEGGIIKGFGYTAIVDYECYYANSSILKVLCDNAIPHKATLVEEWTVGQWTSLWDFDLSHAIWEGDILANRDNDVFVVVFDEREARFAAIDSHLKRWGLTNIWIGDNDIRVIGNISENMQLLRDAGFDLKNPLWKVILF